MFTRTLAIITLVLSGLIAIPAQARNDDHGPRISITFATYQNVWVPGYWERHGHHRVWVEGYWTRQPVYHHGHHYGHERRDHHRYDGHHDKHRSSHYSRKCG